MNFWRGLLRRSASTVRSLLLALSVASFAGLAQAEPCVLASQHAGLTFPVEKVAPVWACRLQSIISDYTTATKVGPIRASISKSMYHYLLDRPPLAAALINRLDFGLYKAERRGVNLFWGNDGEGTEGTVELAYQDRTSRIYYLEGSHYSRLLPKMTGKAVLFLRMNPMNEAGGGETMESTMVSYVKLNNRFVAGLLSILRPLIGGVVSHKLAKGVGAVNRLGLEMRDHPDRVLFEATDPPSFAAEDVSFLTDALGRRPHPSLSVQPTKIKP
ncbi:hypothetical protein [Petrachloros mirabilis]